MGTWRRSERGNFLSEGPEFCWTLIMALAVSPLVCSNLACGQRFTLTREETRGPYPLNCKGKPHSILPIVKKARVLIQEMLRHISHSSARVVLHFLRPLQTLQQTAVNRIQLLDVGGSVREGGSEEGRGVPVQCRRAACSPLAR